MRPHMDSWLTDITDHIRGIGQGAESLGGCMLLWRGTRDMSRATCRNKVVRRGLSCFCDAVCDGLGKTAAISCNCLESSGHGRCRAFDRGTTGAASGSSVARPSTSVVGACAASLLDSGGAGPSLLAVNMLDDVLGGLLVSSGDCHGNVVIVQRTDICEVCGYVHLPHNSREDAVRGDLFVPGDVALHMGSIPDCPCVGIVFGGVRCRARDAVTFALQMVAAGVLKSICCVMNDTTCLLSNTPARAPLVVTQNRCAVVLLGGHAIDSVSMISVETFSV